MKSTQLRINKKNRLRGIRKIKIEIKDVVHDCLLDIENYIVEDIMSILKKKGVIVYAKAQKKNKKKTKK